MRRVRAGSDESDITSPDSVTAAPGSVDGGPIGAPLPQCHTRRTVIHMEMTSPAVVYRMYDESDTLLYVGCTHELEERLAAHRRQKSWTARAVRVDVQQFDTRADALAAEEAAIRRERPRYNIQPRSGPGETSPVSFRVDPDLMDAARESAAQRGVTVTRVVREYLRRYVGGAA